MPISISRVRPRRNTLPRSDSFIFSSRSWGGASGDQRAANIRLGMVGWIASGARLRSAARAGVGGSLYVASPLATPCLPPALILRRHNDRTRLLPVLMINAEITIQREYWALAVNLRHVYKTCISPGSRNVGIFLHQSLHRLDFIAKLEGYFQKTTLHQFKHARWGPGNSFEHKAGF